MSYSYPPSPELLKYGALEDKSNFYCDGVAIVNHVLVRRMRCEFEIAYTQSGKAFAVCYFSLDEEKFHAHPKYEQIKQAQKLIGKDRRTGLLVVADILHWRNFHQSFKPRKDISVTFEVSCYQAYIPPNKLSTLSEEQQNLQFCIAGIDFPEWMKPNTLGEKLVLNNVEFKLSPEITLILYGSKFDKQRAYDNEATGKIAFIGHKLPEQWTEKDIVEFWCSLMSLALGRDIHWTSYYRPVFNLTEGCA